MTRNTKAGHDPRNSANWNGAFFPSSGASPRLRGAGARGAGPSLKDSTIRTVLRRLEEKGYLAHSVENRTFVYRPAETRQRVAGRAAKRIVDWFCEGSVEALLVGMVDSKVL